MDRLDTAEAAVSSSRVAVNPYLAENVRKRKQQVISKPFDPLASDNEGTDLPSDGRKKHQMVHATGNSGLAYWERLPSRNLTFGSAEILTVDECLTYQDLYQGKAVRVTGHLYHRSFITLTENSDNETITTKHQESTKVLLELIHVETTSSIPSGRTPMTKTPLRLSRETATTPLKSFPSIATITSSTVQGAPFKTPTLGGRTGGDRGGQRSLLSSHKRKRPWFPSTTKSNSKSTPNSSINTSNQINKPSTRVLPIRLLKVLVDPESPQLSDIVVSSSEDNCSNRSTSTPTTKVMVIGTMLEDGSIEARFVVLVDVRMDMHLYVTALMQRRRFLYQRHCRLQQQELIATKKDATETACNPENKEDIATSQKHGILIQGCGPPPYDKLLEAVHDSL